MLKGTVDVYGLDEIKNYIDPTRINKELAQGVGLATLQLHNALKHAVFTRYAVRQDVVDKALVGKSSSTQTFGKNVILNGLEYRSKLRDLTYFPYSVQAFGGSTLGNINASKTGKEGKITKVQVKRGSYKVSRGKKGYGGFVQKNPKFGGKPQIFERKQKATWLNGRKKKRAPLRLLFGPTVVDMIDIMYRFDPKVKQVLNNFENIIIEKFI